MACELWAVDAGAGEAVLSQEASWYLVSFDTAWRPVRLGGPPEVLRWAMAGWVVNIGSLWETLEEAVVEARRICRSGARTSSEIQALLYLDEETKAIRRLLVQHAGRLDRHFERHGHSADVAVDLTLETVRRLGPGEKRLEALFESALNAAGPADREEAHEDSVEEMTDLGRFRGPEFWRDRVLGRLPAEVLESLALWADGYTEEEIVVVLHRTREEIQEHMEQASESLGRTPGQLRSSGLAEACRRLL